jgi:hypothetical protein
MRQKKALARAFAGSEYASGEASAKVQIINA